MIRPEQAADENAIRAVETAAIGRGGEALDPVRGIPIGRAVYTSAFD